MQLSQGDMQDGIRNTYEEIASRAKILAAFRVFNLLDKGKTEPFEDTAAAVKLTLEYMVKAAVEEALETMRSFEQEISRQLF